MDFKICVTSSFCTDTGVPENLRKYRFFSLECRNWENDRSGDWNLLLSPS